MTIGKKIKELRLVEKLTQAELATKLFVSQDTISLWELDKSIPSVPDVVKIAKIFNVTTDYLLGLED